VKRHFQAYLEAKGFPPKAVAARVRDAARVERQHGDLDRHFAADRLASLVAVLTYTEEDERAGRADPSGLALSGNLRDALAASRAAVELYAFFCCDIEEPAPAPTRPLGVPVRAFWTAPAADRPLPAGA
jgi:hypothetical protein